MEEAATGLNGGSSFRTIFLREKEKSCGSLTGAWGRFRKGD